MDKPRALLIEDDADIAKLVDRQLQELGFDVHWVSNGEEGLAAGSTAAYAIIILDLELPRVGGTEVCRRLRADGVRVPIMMLTGRADLIDKVLGLELGADEYLTKPFHLAELTARIRALVRRSGMNDARSAAPTREQLTFLQLTVDPHARSAELAGERLDLTKTELDLLILFMKNPGRVLTREDLLRSIWDTESLAYESSVTTHVSRLRAKLGPQYDRSIVTVRGLGYRMVTVDELTGAPTPRDVAE